MLETLRRVVIGIITKFIGGWCEIETTSVYRAGEIRGGNDSRIILSCDFVRKHQRVAFWATIRVRVENSGIRIQTV
eukprot:9761725-Heterocapsa_arctica.AAC.1